MNTHHKAAILGCLAVATGMIVWKRWAFRMPFKEFTRYALYMAVMDDEICRNELEGNDLGGVRIEFPDKMDSLQMRYHLFLQMWNDTIKPYTQGDIMKLRKGVVDGTEIYRRIQGRCAEAGRRNGGQCSL